ncbi:TPA: hypothetical protein LLB39_002267 [Enterococcus faecium]|uniref:hypothetical protein n=1 Tax=Enterococcus faecium TaxID=1352 RepID=UPI0021FC9E91|nr:hypothetical protein [Enterococcus faecium]EKZ0022942.1 hypothetical protein [Enterococcus faecium]EKZ0025886.1 hypothetical protein [Enterococcus faecium]EKZ0061179.1 hypothetical protein [Enterococcus faecium]ELI7226650.1 hypothetical protein [Enterococcus faecium]BDP48361.1 hypothetical protein EfmJHP9_32310 [Enterococcus faecium]
MKELEDIKKRNPEILEMLNENRDRMFSYYESMRCLNKSRSEIIESSKYKQLMEEKVSLIQDTKQTWIKNVKIQKMSKKG